MVSVPARLIGLPFVELLLRDEEACVLRKRLDAPAEGRQSYLSQHAFSVVLAGEQRIVPYDGEAFVIRKGEVGFLPRGMYTVSDLLTDGEGFETYLFFLNDAVAEAFLANEPVSEADRQGVGHFLRFRYTPILAGFIEGLRAPQKRSLKAFMERHFDKPLKVEDYAYLTGRSVSTFRREFKERFADTPQEWLKSRRLEKARQLLAPPSETVSGAAAESGYESVSHFIQAFRQRYGLTPKALQRELQAGRQG